MLHQRWVDKAFKMRVQPLKSVPVPVNRQIVNRFPTLLRSLPMLAVSALLSLGTLLTLPAQAQQPPRLEPVPAPPPAPPGIRDDELTERPIRITPGANEQIEETVMNGRRAIKVTQPNGNVYYLVEELGDQDNALHNSVKIGRAHV